jgi:predicted nucleic acid-binding protein
MPQYVVDASVAAKWYFEEEHSAEAARLLTDDDVELLAPDFIRLEVAAVAWKRVIRNEITPAKAEEIAGELARAPIDLAPSVDLVAATLHTALPVRRSVYDSVYLTYAVQAGALLLTGDRKFYDAIKAGELAPHIAWIGDLAQ